MNEKTKKIIKSTAPILKQHGEDIASAMYVILFKNHPEVKDLFKNSTSDQYKKLANAVYSYANNIDKLENLSKGIDKIVMIHVNSKIKAEHYPLVGESLLEAIKEVLGDIATQEVVDAWEQAYNFLADILINKEKELYAAS